jgi:hypothetical protein
MNNVLGGFINGMNQNRNIQTHVSVEDFVRSALGNRFIDSKPDAQPPNLENMGSAVEAALQNVSEVLIASSEITAPKQPKIEDPVAGLKSSETVKSSIYPNSSTASQNVEKEIPYFRKVIAASSDLYLDEEPRIKTPVKREILNYNEEPKITPVNKKSEYDFHRDVNETFECLVSIEGSSSDNCIARLILKTDTWNLIFDGVIKKNGTCSVPLKKLTIFPEGTTGYAQLEIAVDDVLFIPWESPFRVTGSKKVIVKPPVVKTSL